MIPAIQVLDGHRERKALFQEHVARSRVGWMEDTAKARMEMRAARDLTLMYVQIALNHAIYGRLLVTVMPVLVMMEILEMRFAQVADAAHDH